MRDSRFAHRAAGAVRALLSRGACERRDGAGGRGHNLVGAFRMYQSGENFDSIHQARA
jgi:hypothetical protein